MTAEKRTIAIGWRVYGLGVMALGAVGLTSGDFLLGQPVPKDFPARTALAYIVAAFLLVAGAAIEWQRTARWGAAALTAYYTFIVIVLMNGRLLLTQYAVFGTYSGIAEELGIAAAALMIYASRTDGAERFIRIGQIAFGICALLFGGAHFVYMNLTAPLVPKWLPPSQVFWGYATGVAFIAAGVAILTGVQARLAAILLTAMLGCFEILVHAPILLANPKSSMNWTEAVINLVLMGAAWVVADSLAADNSRI